MCVGGFNVWGCVRGNSVDCHTATTICECVFICVSLALYVCVCIRVFTILNYVPVDVQRCLFWKRQLLESPVACVGEGAYMYSMHVLYYFCSYPVSICPLPPPLILCNSQDVHHVRAGELCPSADRGSILVDPHMQQKYLYIKDYLVQFDHHRACFLFLFILLHFRLESLVVLQCLLPTFHWHVEAGEDTTVPVGQTHKTFNLLAPAHA